MSEWLKNANGSTKNLKFVSKLSIRFKVAKFGRKILNAAKKGPNFDSGKLFPENVLH